MAKNKKYVTLETDNDEYLCVYVTEEGKIAIHVGYYEAELKNSQVDELIKTLKTLKAQK